MNAAHDFVALDWIKDEVGQTLDQARAALQAAADSPEDLTSLRNCLTAIHQIHGTFLMVALKGPADIAKEMENLVQALVNNRVGDIEKAQEALMQSILQMPRYLESLQRQQRELPQVSLFIVNNLRVARGVQAVAGLGGTEPAAGKYDIGPFTTPASSSARAAFEKFNGVVNVPKLRQKYLQALLALLKKEKPRENLVLMGKVFEMLERICGDAPMGHLSRLMAAFIEGLGVGVIRLDNTSANYLKQLDKSLKSLAQSGANGLESPVDETFVKDVMDRICEAWRGTSKMLAVKDKYVTLSADYSENMAAAIGPDDETLGKVVYILMQELKGITDKLDLYTRAQTRDKSDLVSMVPILDQISSTLSMVGLTEQQEMVNKQVSTLKQLESSAEEPVDEQLLEMAEAFLAIETKLIALVGDDEDQGELAGFGNLGEAQSLVVKETRVGLSLCTKAIADLIASDWDRSRIDGLTELLVALRGSLGMLDEQRAGDVMLACARYIEKIYLETDRNPDSQELDNFADAIASIDYYLERLLENNQDPQTGLIEVAEASVEKLGFEVKEVLEREASRPRPEEIDSTSELIEEDEFPVETGQAPVDELTIDELEVEAPEFDDSLEETTIIRNQIHEAAARIKKLSGNSKRIGDVVLLINDLVALISDITDQTNILSSAADLQDSVTEESGTGFSLAAGEIQRLAERSGIAAKQLSALVEVIQSRSDGSRKELELTDSTEVIQSDFSE